MLHRPEWQMLIDLPTIEPILTAIFGSSDYIVRAASGDFCLPGAVEYQPLHSDVGDFVSPGKTPFSSFHDPRGHMSIRDLPCPYVCVNFMPIDMTRLNGPTRQIPGTQRSRVPIPRLSEEPEWMRLSTVCPAPAGAVQIRDVRPGTAARRICPTACAPSERRVLRALVPRAVGARYLPRDWSTLSDRARQLTRFVVADSADELDTSPTLTPPR